MSVFSSLTFALEGTMYNVYIILSNEQRVKWIFEIKND